MKGVPGQFSQQYLKASFSDFTAFTEGPQQSRRKCVFSSCLAQRSAWCYQAAAQHLCPEKRLCVLDAVSWNYTGSSDVSPIKLSSAAFISCQRGSDQDKVTLLLCGL